MSKLAKWVQDPNLIHLINRWHKLEVNLNLYFVVFGLIGSVIY